MRHTAYSLSFILILSCLNWSENSTNEKKGLVTLQSKLSNRNQRWVWVVPKLGEPAQEYSNPPGWWGLRFTILRILQTSVCVRTCFCSKISPKLFLNIFWTPCNWWGFLGNMRRLTAMATISLTKISSKLHLHLFAFVFLDHRVTMWSCCLGTVVSWNDLGEKNNLVTIHQFT